jgi:hypothetical protein
MLRDILFYVWILMVLPTLAYHKDTLIDWLWWYPPRLRRMRIFRLRRLVGFFFIWCAMCTPIIIVYERSRRSSPLFGIQKATSGGSIIF